MKKKLVVLMMAGTMVLAACNSTTADTTTAASAVETTVADTEATTESTEAESTEAESTEAESTEAESTEAGSEVAENLAGVEAELAAALADIDLKSSMEMIGVTIEEKDGGYVFNYPATAFAGVSAEDFKASLEADGGEGITVNEDGTVSQAVTADQYKEMEEEFNSALGAMVPQQ